jgi:ketosteroid isomerase-like protein
MPCVQSVCRSSKAIEPETRRAMNPMAMNPEATLRQYLAAYERKDLAAIDALLHDSVWLQDWNLSAQGKAAVLAETRKNFDGAQTLTIETRRVMVSTDTAAAELHIVVNEHIALDVVDVLQVDAQGRILSIRAYKG